MKRGPLLLKAICPLTLTASAPLLKQVLELRNNLQSGPSLPPIAEGASSHDTPSTTYRPDYPPPLASVTFTPHREAEPGALEAPGKQYAVQTGDCLYGISRQYGVDVK